MIFTTSINRLAFYKKFLVALLTFALILWLSVLELINTNSKNNILILPWSDRDDRFVRIHNGHIYTGRKFSIQTLSYLSKLGLDSYHPLANFCTGQEATILKSQPVFVSAMSDNHFTEGLDNLRHLSILYGKKPIIILYDIGLSTKNIATIKEKYGGTSILIALKSFPFDDFPKNMRNLFEYHWKPIIIALELVEHPSLLWMDSSILHHGVLDSIYAQFHDCSQYFDSLTENSSPSFTQDCTAYCKPRIPWLTFDSTGHSLFAATHPGMFSFLPMPENLSKSVQMRGAGLQLIYRLHGPMRQVMRFWVLCALEPDCMAPKGSNLRCSFGNDSFTRYAGCNRFDQSAINILLAWYTNFNLPAYYENSQNLLQVVRD